MRKNLVAIVRTGNFGQIGASDVVDTEFNQRDGVGEQNYIVAH